MSDIMMQIHYKSLVEGWLQRLRYPDSNPIFEIRAPRRLLSLDSCSFELRASSNILLIEGQAFAYPGLLQKDSAQSLDYGLVGLCYAAQRVGKADKPPMAAGLGSGNHRNRADAPVAERAYQPRRYYQRYD